MKRQIRTSVFETNSSSTHSIAISKTPATIGKSISFYIGEYGWENDCVDTANYIYTAILYIYNREVAEEKIEHLKRILDKYDVSYKFEEPEYETSRWGTYLKHGYIDHGAECTNFIEAVLNDEDMLMRYLFGNSFVYTGNDNQDDRPSGCNIAEKYVYVEDDNGDYVEQLNEYHDEENYEYFYKGN